MKRAGLIAVLVMLPWLTSAAAPDVQMPDVTGKPHHMREYIGRGQPTLVAVWSVDCVICQRDIPELAFLSEDLKKKNATVLGVSVDGTAESGRVKTFVGDNGIGFPNLVGERDDVERFGGGKFLGTPTYLFFSPEGKLVARRVGAVPLPELEQILVQQAARGGKPSRKQRQ